MEEILYLEGHEIGRCTVFGGSRNWERQSNWMDLGHGIGRGTIFGGSRYWERFCICRDTVLEEVQYLEGPRTQYLNK